MRLRLLPAAVACLLALSACGGGSSSAAGTFPTVKGSYGEKPTITTSGSAPKKLESKVLRRGDGVAVQKGDLLVASYLGKVWGGKVFDSSFSRGEPAAFPIGVGKVIPGWDKTLVGVPLGSRMLLVIPPSDGYGSSGNSAAGIKGTDTLVFVVDLVKTYAKSAGGDPNATKQTQTGPQPKVTGALGQPATISVPAGVPVPKKARTIVLAKGHGDPVKAGLTIVQYAAVSWDNKQHESTWEAGQPAGVPVGEQGRQNAFDALAGIPVGSRVLLEIPQAASSGTAGGGAALVVDIVAQPTAG